VARRRPFVRSSDRRRTSWELGPQELLQQQFTATSSIAWNGAAGVLEAGATLVRVRGFVDMFVESAVAGGDAYIGAHGLCMITADANTAGAFPDPLTEDGWDGWLWHSFFSTYVPAAADLSSWQHSRLIIDSKSMRKLNETDVLIGITEVDEVNAGSTLILQANTRTLVMLS